MDIVMIFTLLFGGISIVLFLIASGLSESIYVHVAEKPSKIVAYSYVLAIVFMILAIIIFQASSYTVGDLIRTTLDIE